MKHLIWAILAALSLSACATTNHSIGSVQFNSGDEPYPEDYIDHAIRLTSGRPLIEGESLRVSEPNTMVGRTAFSPKRWYVCVRGLQPKGSIPVVTAKDKIENLLIPRPPDDHYDVVVIFRDGHQPITTEGFNGRLCRRANFT